jgi:peptide/nickel transport system ATP-binding protein
MHKSELLLLVEDARCAIPTPHGDVLALGGVSITLARGKSLGVVGESGSGKSTLAKFVIGALNPSQVSGRVLIDGTDLATMRPRAAARIRGKRIGMVFQDPMMALNPVVPVGRQITETMHRFLGLSRTEATERAVRLLDQVGVPDGKRRLGHYAHQFSGGLRQRITIAMALASEPDLLIADEATTALDVTVQRQILDLLSELAHSRGLSMIMVSHDLSVIAGRTDSTAVMYAGRIVESGDTADVFRNPQHPYTQALLKSVPRIDIPPHSRLATIPGTPPNLGRLLGGCAFAPRCALAQTSCRTDDPPLTKRKEGSGAVRCPVAVTLEVTRGTA